MDEIAISKFKATCLAVLERVRRTRRPITVTRFGKPVAQVIPPAVPARPEGWLGCMEGTVEFDDDIVSPTTDEAAWEALRQ